MQLWTKRALAAAIVVIVAGVLLMARQQPQAPFAERAATMSKQAEEKGLAEPFKGITRAGSVEPGLFSLRSTGISTRPIQEAADAWLATLTADGRKKALFPVEDDEWRKWMNQHFYVRQGVGLLEMTDAQREAAFGLLRASLSAKGLKLSRDIMKLNHTLGELNNDNFVEYGEGRYWLALMGTPSATEPWGWQLDGHHLIVNYFVLGDQVVVTPFFAGSEPVIARSGKYAGTAILQDEQKAGLDMLLALDDAQRAKAIVRVSKTGNDNVGEAFKDNVVLDYAGIRASDLSASQKKQLLALIELYVSNIREGHAKVRMEDVRQHLDATYFAWIGGNDPGAVYYYRIHNPVILIEFDHQMPAGLRHVTPPGVPNRDHIHTVVRTPNGNDYGKDLLRQHYAQHPHPHSH
jgi:hypothetical protein